MNSTISTSTESFTLSNSASTFLNRIIGTTINPYTKISLSKESSISLALTANLNQIPIRSILYKLLLRILPIEKPFLSWLTSQSNLLTSYASLKLKQSLPSIKHIQGDPLSSSWHMYYSDKTIKDLIKLDIDRGDYLSPTAKELISSVLFIWAKEHPAVSYRQGMNDIAYVLYMSILPMYHENIEELSQEDINAIYNDELLRESKADLIYLFFHDADNGLEADLYALFNAFMERGIDQLYDSDSLNKEKMTKLQERISKIQSKLKVVDKELYYHFEQVEIVLGSFLQRWLKCLLIREFPLEQVIELWDAIIAYEFIDSIVDKSLINSFMFLDDIIIAMIIRLRDQLLKCDQVECLRILFDYPRVSSVTLLKESEEVRKKLMMHKGGDEVSVVLNCIGTKKENRAGNRLIPEDLSYTLFPKTMKNGGSLSAFLKKTTSVNPNHSSISNYKDNEDKNFLTYESAINTLSILYDKYKGTLSDTDSNKFSSALDFLKKKEHNNK